MNARTLLSPTNRLTAVRAATCVWTFPSLPYRVFALLLLGCLSLTSCNKQKQSQGPVKVTALDSVLKPVLAAFERQKLADSAAVRSFRKEAMKKPAGFDRLPRLIQAQILSGMVNRVNGKKMSLRYRHDKFLEGRNLKDSLFWIYTYPDTAVVGRMPLLLQPPGFSRTSDSIPVILNDRNYERRIIVFAMTPGQGVICAGRMAFYNCDFSVRKHSRPQNAVDSLNARLYYPRQGLIRSVQYNAALSMYNTRLSIPVTFEYCLFKDSVIIYNPAKAAGPVPSFSNCIFNNGIYFSGKKLDNKPRLGIYYDQNTVDSFKTAPVTGNRFVNDLTFRQCRLFGKLDLSHCSFDSTRTLALVESTLPDTIDLTRTRLGSGLDLVAAAPNARGRKCEIILLNTDISKVKMQYRNFHLYFPNHMADSERYYDAVNSTYELLLNNFKKNGYDESYKALDIEYKKWQGGHDFLLKISEWWWLFGYWKWLILVYSLLFILGFGTYNFFYFRQLQRVYPVKKLYYQFLIARSGKKRLFWPRYYFSLLYTAMIFFKFSFEFKEINYRPRKFLTVLIVQYTIGLIFTGFLINWVLGK